MGVPKIVLSKTNVYISDINDQFYAFKLLRKSSLSSHSKISTSKSLNRQIMLNQTKTNTSSNQKNKIMPYAPNEIGTNDLSLPKTCTEDLKD